MDVTHGAWNLWTLSEEFLDTDQSNQPNMHRLVLFCFPVINLRLGLFFQEIPYWFISGFGYQFIEPAQVRNY